MWWVLAGCLHAHEAPTLAALTLDDLPYQTLAGKPAVDDIRERKVISDAILAALEERSTQAAVFVNCALLAEGEDLPERWGLKGHLVANHTAHHTSIDKAIDWQAEIASCDDRLRSVRGYAPLFRYPYLRQGASAETKARGEEVLASLSLRNAPPTVPTSEWLLAQRYDDATEPAQREAIAELFVDHVVSSIRIAEEESARRLRREIPHVVLLHVNRLEADHIGDLLDRFEQENIRVISLEEALKDEIYSRPDEAISPWALSWLYRVAPALQRGELNRFSALEGRIEQLLEGPPVARLVISAPPRRQDAVELEIRRRLLPLQVMVGAERGSDGITFTISAPREELGLVEEAIEGQPSVEITSAGVPIPPLRSRVVSARICSFSDTCAAIALEEAPYRLLLALVSSGSGPFDISSRGEVFASGGTLALVDGRLLIDAGSAEAAERLLERLSRPRAAIRKIRALEAL